MTHISKNILNTKVEAKLVKQLAKFFSEQTDIDAQNLFSDLLSQSEQTMLIKRLAVVIMLQEKYSTYAVAKTLLVSNSTVREIKIKFTLGHYSYLINRYENKRFNRLAFWQALETLLNAGMPSLGKDRWKSLR